MKIFAFLVCLGLFVGSLVLFGYAFAVGPGWDIVLFSGGLLGTFTNNEGRLDQANRARAVADLRNQAKGEVPMNLARQAARQAVERSFAMPLQAAGFADAKVVARFAGEPDEEPSYLDRSISYNAAIEEARRRRAAQGQR